MVGGGSMPTVGTSNVTLTVAALCLRSARAMLAQLDSESAPVDVSAGRRHAASLSGEVSR
jgi:choline dehydrogenase-like flavoprotein